MRSAIGDQRPLTVPLVDSILPAPHPLQPGGNVTVRASDVSQLDVGAVQTAFEACVRQTCPDQVALAHRLLDRLAPSRWTLEWYLPWWLGRALALDPATTQEVVLGNVLGLGSIRLQDDLTDGEVAPGDVAGARRLAAALYESALAPYRARFEPSSPFWDHLVGAMSTWRAAMANDGEPRLAARGAPLKISAYALCLLAGRTPAYEAIEPCMDQALEALVRLDHLADWRVDLDAGRWNAFVADVSIGPQVPEARQRHRRAVLVAMMTTDVVADQVARIRSDFLRAAALAEVFGERQALPLPEFVEHLERLAVDAAVQGATLSEHYRDLGDRAAKLLSGPVANARS